MYSLDISHLNTPGKGDKDRPKVNGGLFHPCWLVCLFVCLFFMWNNGSFFLFRFIAPKILSMSLRRNDLSGWSAHTRDLSGGLSLDHCSTLWLSCLWLSAPGPAQNSKRFSNRRKATVHFLTVMKEDVTDATFWLILIVFVGLCGTEEEDPSGFTVRILLVCFSTCDWVTR